MLYQPASDSGYADEEIACRDNSESRVFLITDKFLRAPSGAFFCYRLLPVLSGNHSESYLNFRGVIIVMKIKSKSLALLLSLAMIFTFMPASVFAAACSLYAAGFGDVRIFAQL